MINFYMGSTSPIDFSGIALDMMSQMGYWGLTLGLVLDSFGVPIPSEVLLVVGGALAATGRFDTWVVFVLGTLAQVIGGLIGYLIGRYGGEPLLERYGKYVLISKRDLRRTHEAFEKYGALLAMMGRCVPVIRGLIAYPAGIAEMNFTKFLIFTTIGSAIWTAIFVYLGYVAGNNLDAINSWVHKFTIVVVVAIVAWILWHFREHIPVLRTVGEGRRGRSKAEKGE